MKEAYYFSHDYNARSDEKIKRLIRKHGMTGYGIYWSIIEDLYTNTNVLRLDYDGISFDFHTENEVVKSIINDFDLFVIDGLFFSSESVKRRMEERNEKSVKAKESISKRWEKYERNTNVLQTEYDSNTIKERKGKESKVKEIYKNISFDVFWNLYDKKSGDKDKLKIKWEKLSHEDQKQIIEYIPKYKESQPDKKFRKNPETFLNNKSWMDEIIISPEKKVIHFRAESIKLPDDELTPEDFFKKYGRWRNSDYLTYGLKPEYR